MARSTFPNAGCSDSQRLMKNSRVDMGSLLLRFRWRRVCEENTKGDLAVAPRAAARQMLLGGTKPFAGLRAPAGAAAIETLVARPVAHHDRPAVRARRCVLLVEERRAGLRDIRRV